MKSKLKPAVLATKKVSSNKCLRPNSCRYCPKINTDGHILCTASGRTYMSRYNVCCSSSNIIYCLTCKRCGIQYVGQTKCELKVRFSSHFLKITKNDPESEIARHFNSGHHMGLDDVMIHIVDFIHEAPDTGRAKYLRDLLFSIFLIVCFTRYFLFRIAVLPHSPGVVYYHLLLEPGTFGLADECSTTELTLLLEFNWIQRLHTNAPMGLNVMDLLRS